MRSEALLVDALVNSDCYASTMIDSGNLVFAMISPIFAKKARLQCMKIAPRKVIGIEGSGQIDQVARFKFNIDGYQDYGWGYIANQHPGFDIILGKPWMDKRKVTIAPFKQSIYVHSTGQRIRLQARNGKPQQDGLRPREISAVAYVSWIQRSKTDSTVKVFAASMADIQKALAPKAKVDHEALVPEAHKDRTWIFDPKTASAQAPFRPGVDHAINLEKGEDGKEKSAPWGPLYNMSRGELLVLRKHLTSLLDKGWIRVSNSPAAAPVLFAKKPGGGLRFCVDYRALNAITRKDRYPLPLIRETLNNIAKAKYFTKIDVSAAFHKVRIREGDEWKTAFRTRFGLYEWLVTPFGLANAPSTFQRYINWTLREYIDDFCSAYMDDVLIYTDGSLKQHHKNVNKVLDAMGASGLPLDISKCEFDVTSTKYLGFIIEAGKGLRMDPEKVKAIKEWETPRTQKGIRSFLGFANFYRRFVKDYSGLVAPLTALTGSSTPFRWGKEQQDAFDKLKDIFITEPVLAQFDWDRETVLETDSSGWSTSGVLSQYGDDGLLHPVAYFSKKMNVHEANYEIHDKELLAVINCLKEWDAELRSVPNFTVITDHKNLEYFMKPRQLNDRQMRWSLILGRYQMVISYRPGKLNERADALSRREQDMPEGASDERLQHRYMQLLKPVTVDEIENPDDEDPIPIMATRVAEQVTPTSTTAQGDLPFEEQWAEARARDEEYLRARQAVLNGERRFPVEMGWKASISECSVDEYMDLRYRDRRWVPNDEPLRTGIICTLHTSPALGHPGRDSTYRAVARDFFWPNMSDDIRRYIRNCDICGQIKPWRDGLHGLLKPLPLPERIWKEISMDFIVGLPESEGCTNLMVITDRLSKDVVLIPLPDIEVPTVVDAFIRFVVAYHWLPDAIVSDRGTQFVSEFWTMLCKLCNINRRLSTAWHPQTDGSTERMNSTVEAYLRAYIAWDQKDWAKHIGMATIAIKAREAAATKMSPFFLQHGYHVDPLQLRPTNEMTETLKSNEEKALAIVDKLKKAFDLAHASMANNQQEQEKQANKKRKEAVQLRVGDKVWLALGTHIRTTRMSKKLDWKNSKYTVVRLVGTHAVELDTPGNSEKVFNMDRLRLAADDPLPSQPITDRQPEPIVIDGDAEYFVEKIMDERKRRRGRGFQHQLLVKWEGYQRPSWEPALALIDTKAFATWRQVMPEVTIADRPVRSVLKPRS